MICPALIRRCQNESTVRVRGDSINLSALTAYIRVFASKRLLAKLLMFMFVELMYENCAVLNSLPTSYCATLL